MDFMTYIDKSALQEALVSTKSDVKLNTSSTKDPGVVAALELYAESTGIDYKDAKNQFESQLALQQAQTKNSKNHKNTHDNAAASIAFNMLDSLDASSLDLSRWGIDDNDDLLDRDYFFDLTQYVLGENAQFFPLKNPFETRAVKPYFYIYPDHAPLMVRPGLRESAAQCETAFCTTKAEMVFSRPFAESLALNALVTGVKPKSKKYKSNGGGIPDHYCYLEFVIMHELLHYSAGDHFYTKQMVKKIQKDYPTIAHHAHLILNYVGDYINNWQLVASGYEQLPIGLFSEELNYDKFDTYEEVIKAVADEMLKTAEDNPNELQDLIDALTAQMDDHIEGDDGEPSQGGSGSEPSEQGDAGEEGEEGGEEGGAGAEGGEEGGEDGGGGPTDAKKAEGGAAAQEAAEAIDKAMKENKEKVANRDDGNNDAKAALDARGKASAESLEQMHGKTGAGSSVEFKEVNTTINWKKLLKKMIPSGDGELEDTYSKMSRQATSSMVTAMQTGTGRVSPGEIMIDTDKRGLCFIIDNSGSVMDVVGQFNQEIIQLLKKNKSALDNFYIIKFSDMFELYKVDVRKFKARIIKNPKTFASKKPKPQFGPEIDAKGLFTVSDAAGTQYTPEMHKAVEFLHNQMINMIMFTDDDLVLDPYTAKFYKLAKKRKNSLAMFLTDARSHKNMTAKFGNYKWVTVIK